MAIRAQISCINKRDRPNIHERILTVGGINPPGAPYPRWKLSQEEAIKGIQEKKYDFFVRLGTREVQVIIGTSPYNNLYIKTEADTTEVNNLLSLTECPLN